MIKIDQISLDNIAINTSPENETVIELEFQPTFCETQLDQILEEQQIKEQLQESEKQRLENIKKIPLNRKNRLSTIKETSDLSNSSNYATENEIQNGNFREKNQLSIHQQRVPRKNLNANTQSMFQKKKATPKLMLNNDDYYSSLNLTKYYNDNTIDCRWKLLFTYYTILIASNIILNLIELIRYSESFCKLEGLNNTLIFINQIFYMVCKIGILSITYQEFTNTLPIKVEIPLLNQVVFSCVFPVLSMPLYIFDFVQCQYRIRIFTLDQSLNILNLIDWLILSIIVLIIIFQFCNNLIQNQVKDSWIQEIIIRPFAIISKNNCFYLRLTYYLSLIVVHCISIIMTIGQSFDNLMPAMILENYFVCFSVLLMLYLSVQKYCFKRIPFMQKNENFQQKDQLIVKN